METKKRYQLKIFGKKGCEKCKVLKDRLDGLLAKEEWSEFNLVYHDLETEDGLLSFVKLECLNPQRIPSFVVMKEDSTVNVTEPLINPAFEQEMESTSRPWRYIGLETDYSTKGRGVITPKMITETLKQALAM